MSTVRETVGAAVRGRNARLSSIWMTTVMGVVFWEKRELKKKKKERNYKLKDSSMLNDRPSSVARRTVQNGGKESCGSKGRSSSRNRKERKKETENREKESRT
jgi:hypothetical protein